MELKKDSLILNSRMKYHPLLAESIGYSIAFDGWLFRTPLHLIQHIRFQKHPIIQQEMYYISSTEKLLSYAEGKKDLEVWDWRIVQQDTLEMILSLRINQHEHLRELLLSTGKQRLIVLDKQFGYRQFNHSIVLGTNTFGDILMKIRATL